MTPYYDEDGVTVYHGDCREVLPSLAFDSVITDPPYATGYYRTDGDAFSPSMLAAFVAAVPTAVFGWPEKLVGWCVDAGVKPDEWVTWWPTNGRNRGFNRVGLWREAECIAVFGRAEWTLLRQKRCITTTPMPDPGVRGHPQTDMARMGDVWRDESPNLNPNQPPRLHPNEKSIAVMSRLVQVMTDDGGVIVDPFMGSGTTLRAAKDLGRRAIGVEVEEAYCEVAARRLAQGVLGFGAV
jgi:site-specific DNA-methyltransferase (adenine-specific)